MSVTRPAAVAAIQWLKDRLGLKDNLAGAPLRRLIVASAAGAVLLGPSGIAQPVTRPLPVRPGPVSPLPGREAIRFAAEIPQAPPQMQVYRLAPTKPPVEFLNEKLNAANLGGLQQEGRTLLSRGEKTGEEAADGVRAWVDADTGDADFLPSFAQLVREPAVREAMPAEKAQSVARAAFADPRFIPRDATELRMADAISVMGGAAAQDVGNEAGPRRTEARAMMSMVPAVRYAGGLKVYGRGSHALVSVGNDGRVIGALRRWRTAQAAEMMETRMAPDAIRSDILRQLAPSVAAPGSRATVDKIALAYYDANAGYLQPVVYFEATVQPPPESKMSAFKLAGYTPLGKVLEPIPDLARHADVAGPSTPKQGVPGLGPPARLGDLPTPGDFTLGEYANQDWHADGGYVDMSNTFLNGLLSYPFHGPITRTQWYVAYPWEVVGPSSRYYMNAVNVAYTVPHGDWLYNTTLRNCCEGWYVPNIGTGGNPGYGHAAGGVLATWIIMSCEVIPSMYDRQFEAGGTGNPYHAFDAWWGVFQGLHNAIGFRTIMFYPDDGLQYGFGNDASHGGDLNAAWFHEVAAHDGDDGTYASGHLIGSPTIHYDRASTMIDARNLGQSIYNVTPQSAAGTLWNFWMGN